VILSKERSKDILEASMGQVIRLSKYRRRRDRGVNRLRRPSQKAESAPRYYCHGCDNESFNLFSNGDVRCTRCQGVMGNIVVSSADEGLKLPG
jgi:hypothetical protein